MLCAEQPGAAETGGGRLRTAVRAGHGADLRSGALHRQHLLHGGGPVRGQHQLRGPHQELGAVLRWCVPGFKFKLKIYVGS